MATVIGPATTCSDGGTPNPWVNTSNGTGAPDGSTAENDFNDDPDVATTALNFSVSLTVPVGSTITDVSVDVTRWATGAGVEDFSLDITFTDGNGTQYNSGDIHHTGDWGTTPGASDSYGGDANSLFGSYPVNASTTSCLVTIALQAYHPVGGILAASDALVDAVSASITYTPPAGLSTSGAILFTML